MSLPTSLKLLAAALALGFAASVAADVPTSKRAARAEWSAEGMHPVRIQGLDLAYAQPGASLRGYHSVLVLPVAVALRREWERTTVGNPYRLREQDERRIENHTAALVREELARELAARGVRVVEQPGPGVLEIAASVIDLHLNAPDARQPGRIDVYALSAGEMSLVADLRDAQSGATLMRVFDHARAFETTFPHRITQVESDAQLGVLARGWAHALQRELDRARSSTR